ncbi:efflux RND transporter periplasmic adaptor subunit [Ramlibacter sp.]|uniref:efflux RND transporter periplasmic adaptor subunit n=1 Tax=Ramlibacter sp. TaxID=1917967 RepID=UPI002B8EC9D3|nr:HlyD family efflux transporter periplasmic adaptor subunit [Ramlibacter sp.]HWI81121.1 HlyD family efflux transporter periplasmic adaptor subunit [Ramlibacter sp.]
MAIGKSAGIWAVAGAAALAALAWAFWPRPVEVEAAPVRQGRFEQAIEEDGRTRLKDRYTVSAPVAARLERITLREGDPVAAGQVVAWLRPLMPPMVDERSRREAQARLEAAAAGVDRARARLERARLALREAQLEQQRTERLAADGFLSASKLDSVRLALAGTRRELDAASAEEDQAMHERALAAATLQSFAGTASVARALAVRSPVAGVVLRLAQPSASDATLPAGTALIDVGDPRHMEVVSELLTTDAVQAQPGRRVVIERWGGPPVEGTVRRVEPAAFTKVSALGIEEQRVNTVIDIASPPREWLAVGDGFRVVVRVITNSAEPALLVPIGALFPRGEQQAVYVIDGRRARLQVVETGGRNASDAWVRSGLAAGQQVIVYPPATVADGQRVKVRRP